MAERLLILKLSSTRQRHGGCHWSCRRGRRGHLRDVDLQDLAEIDALLASAPVELRTILYNPLTYLLSAPNAFDPPPVPPTAVALESLADMDAVGLRQGAAPFSSWSRLCSNFRSLAAISLPTSSTVVQWADLLRGRPAVRSLIEMDLEVYQMVAGILQRQSEKQAAAGVSRARNRALDFERDLVRKICSFSGSCSNSSSLCSLS
jgi:hypothetical protein